MKLNVLILSEAESDLTKAYAWYEERLPGLGKKFLASVDRTFRSVQHNPLRFPQVHRHIRRALLLHFPYGVFFIREENSIIILAVLHQAQDPKRWRKRIHTRLWHT